VREVGRPTELRASRPEACHSGGSAIAAEKSTNYEGGGNEWIGSYGPANSIETHRQTSDKEEPFFRRHKQGVLDRRRVTSGPCALVRPSPLP
jgi:hypothetical protein